MFNTMKLLLLLVLLSPASAFVVGQDENLKVDFVSEIKPILENNCFRCHCEEEAEGGYRIDIRDEAMEYIESGDAENSSLYEYLISDDEDEMMPPPDEGGPLDDSDVLLIKTWIDEGAKWPEGVALTKFQDAEPGEEPADPAAGQAKKDEGPNVYRALGTLHPATLHLPMGLLLAAGLFALLSLRGNFVMADCAYYCLWLGTFGAIAACVTGWWFVLDQRPSEYIEAQKLVEGLQDMDHKLFWHRTAAIAATIFALLLALFAASARNKDPDDGVVWKLGVMLLAGAIAYVGHQGGKLTWKPSHYNELYEVIDDVVPGLMGPLEDKNADPQEAEGDAAADGAIGETDLET